MTHDGPLVPFEPFITWKPKIGDFVIKNGMLFTTYGVVSAVESGVIDVITSGLPFLLFSMGPHDRSRNIVRMTVGDIIGSKAGKWTVMQCDESRDNKITWYA